MIPTNDLCAFGKHKVITTVRQLDGAKIIATRNVINEKLPIRWDVDIQYPQASSFRTSELSVTRPLATSELLREARKAGFGDWHPIVEKKVEAFTIDAGSDKSKVQLIPKYPESYTIDYLVD